MPPKVLTLRLDPKQFERIERLNQERHNRKFPGFRSSRPPTPARSDFIRWLLDVGMDQVEESFKKGVSR